MSPTRHVLYCQVVQVKVSKWEDAGRRSQFIGRSQDCFQQLVKQTTFTFLFSNLVYIFDRRCWSAVSSLCHFASLQSSSSPCIDSSSILRYIRKHSHRIVRTLFFQDIHTRASRSDRLDLEMHRRYHGFFGIYAHIFAIIIAALGILFK